MPSVVSCTETYGSRDFDIALNDKGSAVTSHTRTFKVVLSGGGAGADAAAADASGLPHLRDLHPYAAARAKSIRGRSEANDDKVWIIDVEYDTETPSQDEQDQEQPDNPLDEPPDVEWDFEQFSRPLDRDTDGDPVTNSADEQFDPLPEVDDGRLVLRYSRNETSFPVALARDYANTVNSDTFFGTGPGYVKAKPVRGQRLSKRLEDGSLLFYWRLSYEFHFRSEDGEDWDCHLLDQGYREIVDLGGTVGELYLNIHDSEDMPLNKPALLDGSGSELASGAEPVFLDFPAYRRKAFSAFNIT